MAETASIITIIDPTSEEQPALERAIWLATRTGASLDLLVNVYEPFVSAISVIDPVGSKEVQSQLEEDYAEALENLAERARKPGLTVRTEVRADRPLVDSVLQKAQESEASLIVKDTHYHADSRRTIFSGSDWSLIRDCPRPLLLVKPRAISDSPNIVAAVDPTHASDERAGLDQTILSTAAEFAASTGGKLTVFHSFYSPSAIAEAVKLSQLKVDLEQVVEAERQRHHEALDALLATHPDLDAEVVLHDGHAHEGIIGVAIQKQADFVVMGSVARGTKRRRAIGSLAERVLDHLPCDLIIVKPPDFEPTLD